jgi:hypothetical protein
MGEHTPPVPPDDLRARWFMDCASGEKFNTRRHADKAAAWGWEQAISDSKPFILPALTDNGGVILGPAEREELAGLLLDLAAIASIHGRLFETGEPGNMSHAANVYAAADRARAAAERLRGGGE